MWMRPRTRRLFFASGQAAKFVKGNRAKVFGGSRLLSTSSNPPEFLICIWSLVYWPFGARHAKSAVNKCLRPHGHAVPETPFAIH
ncbi:hypothetical protein GQ55_2G437700 [Panicum hallii var. hallii]|uniref:Uncharacterized protein n=1 Tax=Panicum hallii var. hallii TaxID=1504633 RepID=A0A2T7EYR5_9POAL|nr:hypothetical protein GQ55_2G437700 [Panicum hallii var. hallii]